MLKVTEIEKKAVSSVEGKNALCHSPSCHSPACHAPACHAPCDRK